LLGCGLTTALGTIDNECDLRMGDPVVVIGCGGVGLNLIMGARMRTANPIIGIDINPAKQSLAMACGASHFVVGNNQTLPAMMGILPQGARVVIDTTGIPAAIEDGFKMLAASGRLVLVAQPAPGTTLNIPQSHSLFQGTGKTVIATQGGRTDPSTDIPRYINLWRAGLLDYTKVITNRFTLDEINLAIDSLRSGEAGRIMITMKERQDG
jgi:Zn-dependent alcohol dehydrogenase